MKSRGGFSFRTVLVAFPLVILALVYAWSFRRLLPEGAPANGIEPEILRVGHIFIYQKEAFEEMADAYEEMCRQRGENVRIEQIVVPQGIYRSWFITQLVGKTAPDLVAINVGSSTERLARFFEPLSDVMAEPSPYNQGTELEGVPWYSTFPDGLPTSYNMTLLEYYTVPMTNTTTRMLVNLPLYRKIRGDTPLPRTYDEFLELCQATRDYSKKHGLNLVPIAGSQYHAPVVFRFMTRSLTQQLARKLNLSRTMRFTDAEERASYLDGDWSLESPEVYDLLQMTGEIGRQMTPGFLQLQREDGSFYFAQGQSLMLISFSNEAVVIPELTGFETAAFRVPVPTPETPHYGRHVLGRMEDKSYTSNFSIALTRDSKQKARAIDFLQFAGSIQGNQIFCDYSGWVPSVAKVKILPHLEPYLPDLSGGYQLGFDLTSYDLQQAGETRRVFSTYIHLLTDANGGPDRFIEEAGPVYSAALRRDAHKEMIDNWETVQRDDVMIAMLGMLADADVNPESALAKRNRLWEASLEQEATARLLDRAVTRSER